MNVSADMVLTTIGLILSLLQLASAVTAVFQNRDLLKVLHQAALVSVLFFIRFHEHGLTSVRKSNIREAEVTYMMSSLKPTLPHTPRLRLRFHVSGLQSVNTFETSPTSTSAHHQPSNYDLP